MSTIATQSHGYVSDHFVPDATRDPLELKKLKATLDQIDYTAFSANRDVVAKTLIRSDLSHFQRLATATSQARAKWVGAAVVMTAKSPSLSPDQVNQLGVLRRGFEELSEVYEAMRRMVERGYLPYTPPARP